MERRYVEEKYYAGSDFTAQEDRWRKVTPRLHLSYLWRVDHLK
jgi:hypothetical protein